MVLVGEGYNKMAMDTLDGGFHLYYAFGEETSRTTIDEDSENDNSQ